MTDSFSDRRAAVTAGVLVAAVVIVLGFGSGIGAVLSRTGGHGGAAPGTGHDLGTVVQDGGPMSALSSTPARQSAAATMTSRSAGSATAATMSHDNGPTPSSLASTPSDGGATTDDAGSTATPCRGSSLAAAMVEPFVMHFDKAHLETSPGDQVSSALDIDSYVKTHTVLIENMVAPAVDAIIASLTGLQPFVAHVDKAHLETSPGQQVSDLLDVDGYTKTHTVLIENMAAPAMHELTDYGCP
jgi:hypothetical protein